MSEPRPDRSTAPPTGRGGRPRRTEVDDTILAATAELLCEVSLARLSMEMVAARAGVGKPTIYRRWPSKAHLVLDVLVSLAPPVSDEDGDVTVTDLASYKELLRTMTFELYQRVVKSSILTAMPVLVAEMMHDKDLGREFRERYVARRVAKIERVLDIGVEQGFLRDNIAPWLMYKLLQGASFYSLFIEGATMSPEERDQAFDVVWDAISRPQETDARQETATSPRPD